MQATDWLNSGHVYLVQGNWVEAVRCYRKAKDLCDSSDSFLHFIMPIEKCCYSKEYQIRIFV